MMVCIGSAVGMDQQDNIAQRLARLERAEKQAKKKLSAAEKERRRADRECAAEMRREEQTREKRMQRYEQEIGADYDLTRYNPGEHDDD